MPPAARITDMHTCPMQTPAFPSPIPHVGGPVVGPGVPNVLIGKMPAPSAELLSPVTNFVVFAHAISTRTAASAHALLSSIFQRSAFW